MRSRGSRSENRNFSLYGRPRPSRNLRKTVIPAKAGIHTPRATPGRRLVHSPEASRSRCYAKVSSREKRLIPTPIISVDALRKASIALKLNPCAPRSGRAGCSLRGVTLPGGIALFEHNGSVGERLIPPDCKSGARKGYAGSNPARPTRLDGSPNPPPRCRRTVWLPALGGRQNRLRDASGRPLSLRRRTTRIYKP